jgi:hypothetical protein
MEGLKGKFHLPIFDVTIVDVEISDVPILEGRCECAEKKNSEQERRGGTKTRWQLS